MKNISLFLCILVLCAFSVNCRASESNGYWKMVDSPIIKTPYGPMTWESQNLWEGRIYDAGPNHITIGFRHPDVQKDWSKGRSSWVMAPSVLRPDVPIHVEVKHEDIIGPPAGESVSAYWGSRCIKTYMVHQKALSENHEVIPWEGASGQRMTLTYSAGFCARKSGYIVETVYEWVEGKAPAGSGDAGDKTDSKAGSAFPDLSGTWYDYTASTGNKGAVSTIRQTGDQLTFINEFNNQSSGHFIDKNTVIATGWGGLQATLSGNNSIITFTNGSVWQRNKRGTVSVDDKSATKAGSAFPDLSGTWYDYTASTGNKGAVSTIRQTGDQLTFINEFNNQSSGHFIDKNTVIATGWGGLQATLSGNNSIITFTNGSVWQRKRR